MTYFPPTLDVSNSGTISALDQSVSISVPDGMSNWLVQTTGTFVGTIVAELTADGINYVPVNSRQSFAGRLSNSWSAPGLFRGCVSAALKFRVRALTWVSGTANIFIKGAVFNATSGGGTTIPSTKAYLAAAATVGAGGVQQPIMAPLSHLTLKAMGTSYCYRDKP